MFDDRIHVAVDGLSGVIAGSNPRSVLMGVYRYLEGAGLSLGATRAGRRVHPAAQAGEQMAVDAGRCAVIPASRCVHRGRGQHREHAGEH